MARRCPRCRKSWGDTDRFCGDCGARLDQPGRVRPKEPPPPGAPVVWLLETFPGLARPMVLVCSILAVLAAFVAFGLAMVMLSMGVLITAFAAGAGGMIIYWTALGWILYGYLCHPVEALSEFQGRHWMVFLVATTIPGILFMFAFKYATGR